MKTRVLQSALLLLCLCIPVQVALATTQEKTPGTAANDNSSGVHAWQNLTNALTQDDTGTTALENNPSQILNLTNYGFTIPSGSTINGITAVVRRLWVDDPNSTTTESIIQLLKSGTRTGDNKATSNTWPASFTDASYGGSADLWGTTWEASDINSTSFGIAIQVNAVVGSPGLFDTRQIDVATITVDYTAPPPSGGAAARAVRSRIVDAGKITQLLEQSSDLNEFLSGTGAAYFPDMISPPLLDVGIAEVTHYTNANGEVVTAQEYRQQLRQEHMEQYRIRQVVLRSAAASQERMPVANRGVIRQRMCTRIMENFRKNIPMLIRVNNRLQRRFGFVCSE